jgi:peptide/nickel transport system permease protein
MTRFLVRRLLQAVPVLLGISFLLFVLMHAMPGGPLAMYVQAPGMSKDRLAALAAQMGLNKPVWLQYVQWLEGVLHGNFGYSYTYNEPATAMMLQRFPATMELMLTAFAVSVIGSFALGIFGAVRQYSIWDHLVTVASYFGMAMPTFWLGVLLLILFAVDLHWLPSGGMVSSGAAGAGGLGDRIRHLILPAATLAVFLIAQQGRYVRSAMLEVIRADYIRTARAKGLGERIIMWRHALRNALIPVVTVMILNAAFLFGGALVTETIYSWPGMGLLFINAITQADYPVIMAIVSFLSVVIVFANIVADLLYGMLDPRVRLS